MSQRRCGRALVLEYHGDVYSCDHFVDPQHRLGNLHQSPLAQLVNGEEQAAFGQAKEDALPTIYRECDVRFVCNGECPCGSGKKYKRCCMKRAADR